MTTTCANNERPAACERHYPSDTTDAEWAVLEPLLPPLACSGPWGGRPEKHPRRNVVDAIRYINDNGAKWGSVPVDFGVPWRIVYGFFSAGERAGLWPASTLNSTRKSVSMTASIPAPWE